MASMEDSADDNCLIFDPIVNGVRSGRNPMISRRAGTKVAAFWKDSNRLDRVDTGIDIRVCLLFAPLFKGIGGDLVKVVLGFF